MGGKSKQVPRTKGNMRPANSSAFQAFQQPPEGSFLGIASSLVPGFSDDLADIDTVHPNYQVVIRKMKKKDPRTKINALKEFSALVNEVQLTTPENSDIEELKTVLPVFAKLYVQLSTDVDARVREQAQVALLALVSKIGKNLATILKQIFPAWVCSQFDTQPTCASIAVNAFNLGFPMKDGNQAPASDKHSEVFAFCEAEVLDYFVKNLTIINQQTICNSKTYTPEECEEKYNRVVIGSLRGYCYYLEKIQRLKNSREKLENSSNKHLAILESDKFWSHHKSKTPQLRSAFFETLSALMNNGAFLLIKFHEKMTVTVFKSMDEADPAVLSHVWSCIILVQVTVKDWSQYVNINKMFLPKLWKVLRSSLYPTVVFPNLLPLVSQFKKTISPDDQLRNFYTNFFENINHGLRNNKMGKSEMSAVVNAYYEVIRFVIMQMANDFNASEDESCSSFATNLLDDHIIAVSFWCLNEEGVYGRHVFPLVASLIKYWSKSENLRLYQNLVDRFWQEMSKVLKNSLDIQSKIENVTGNQLVFIKSLKDNAVKNVKVKFSEEKIVEANREENCKSDKNLSFSQKLFEVVCELCSVYIEKICLEQNGQFLDSFEALVKDYQSEEFFKILSKQENIFTLIEIFKTWLTFDGLRCDPVVEIALVMYKYLSPPEKEDLLHKWVQVPAAQNAIIGKALSYPLCCEPNIGKLLQVDVVTRHLQKCATNVSNGDYTENLIILQKCFFQKEDGTILIDVATCKKIIEIISEPLSDESKINQTDQCASFLAQIFPVICADPEKEELQQKMFLDLFKFSIVKELSDEISEDTIWEVTSAWQDTISSCDLQMSDLILNESSKIISEKLETISLDKVTTPMVQKIAENVSKFILCATEQENEENKLKSVDRLIKKFLKINGESFMYLDNLGQLIELMNGRLSLNDIDDVVYKSNFMDAFDTTLKESIFNLEVIIRLSCHIKATNNEIKNHQILVELEDEIEFSELQQLSYEDQTIEEDYDSENFLQAWTPEIFDRFLNTCYCETVFNVFKENSRRKFQDHEKWILFLTERLNQFTTHTFVTEQISTELSKKMNEKLLVNNGLWTKCAHKLFKSSDEKVTVNKVYAMFENSETKIPSVSEDQSLDVKIAVTRCLMFKQFNKKDFNDIEDRQTLNGAKMLLNEILTLQKSDPTFLLYNKDVSIEDSKKVLTVAEISLFISDILTYSPAELDEKCWDFIRIALSSLVLSVAKSCENFKINKVKVFIVGVFKLNSAISKFFATEKTKSSTQLLEKMIEEWDKVFAREINLVLIKALVHIIKSAGDGSKSQEYFVDALCPLIEWIDFEYTLQSQKVDQSFSLKDLIDFALENLSSKHESTCVIAATILRKLTRGLIVLDKAAMIKNNSEDDTGKNYLESMENTSWHVLEDFKDVLEEFRIVMTHFVEDFNYKPQDSESEIVVPRHTAFSCLLLWHSVLNFCSQAPTELRSYYAQWITSHQFEKIFLMSLFKLMPLSVIKNPEASLKTGHGAFSSLEWKEIEESEIDIGRYAAYLYAESLRTIPAVVRKWWHASSTRDAQSIEKITQNYVSPILCQQDLTVLANTKDKDGKDNMQIKVLIQSREIFATYSLDEAKMELQINLPPNYPLGAIKINSSKHIAGKLEAREIVKQLSIYLTHQNGRLYDGISLWKRNLDRKYEGVEECYVCYSVIHQETSQLPRLTCKTCKKKFHSNCLYKWFTSSNKSTCPLCRNIF